MKCIALPFLLVWAAVPASVRAQGWDFAACMDGGPSVDIFGCADAAASFDPVAAKLAVVACIADTINEYQIKILDCLETQVADVHAIVMLPHEARRAITEFEKVWKQARTLKQQVESLACGWRFSKRSGLLRDLYLRPIRLCKPEVKFIFGDHSSFLDGDTQELYDWTAKNTRNLVHERTVGPADGWNPARGPEGTWNDVATETAKRIAGLEGDDEASEGWAVRYGAQLAADRLQVETNTLQLRTQKTLVGQQHRDYRALQEHYRQGLRLFVLTQATKGAP